MRKRIALVQFRSLSDDEINMRRMEGFIKSEKGRSDLIVFPEQAIKGTFSESEENGLLKRFAGIAKTNRIDIVPGSVLVRERGRTYNRGYYIDRNGRVLARYDKCNPWKSEKISKGRGPRPFRTRFGKTAMIICWDLASPKIASRLSKLGLDLIVCPAMWWEGHESGAKGKFAGGFIDSLCAARAYESRAVLAYVNAAGKLGVGGFFDMSAGRSQVVAPLKGRRIAKGKVEQVVRYRFVAGTTAAARRYFGGA